MAARLIEASARAFGMLVFVVVSLWLFHKAFPENWLLLALLYVAFIPVAAAYGWLTDPRPNAEGGVGRPRVPALLVVGIGAAIAIFGYAVFTSELDAAFYPILGARR